MVGKILIVDEAATNRIALAAIMADAFYQPILAEDGAACLRMARAEVPDLILIDPQISIGGGLDVIRQLRAQPATRDVPIVAMLAEDHAALRSEALRAGADDTMTRTAEPQTLLARIRNLLRRRDAVAGLQTGRQELEMIGLEEPAAVFEAPSNITLVTDLAQFGTAWKERLSAVMGDKIVAKSRQRILAQLHAEPAGDGQEQAPERSRQQVPDVILIDGNVQGGGLSLMSELRSRPSLRFASICLMRSTQLTCSVAMALDQGADDVVNPDIPAKELAQRLRNLARRKRRDDHLRAGIQNSLRLAAFDPLTGLHNRRYALPQLAKILDHAASFGTTSAVMVIDLDQFKLVNDRLGHAAGDVVLAETARRLRANLRATDLVARIGGDEFLVALPDTSFDEATLAAHRLCQAIEETPMSIGASSNLCVSVTISVGLTVLDRAEGGSGLALAADIMGNADTALLEAKAHGRNQVTVSRVAA